MNIIKCNECGRSFHSADQFNAHICIAYELYLRRQEQNTVRRARLGKPGFAGWWD